MEFKSTFKMATRCWLLVAILAILVFMFFPALVSGGDALRIIINAVVTAGTLFYAYMTGANMGDDELNYNDLLKRRLDNGYQLTDEDKAKSYSRARGLKAMLLGALPWAIVAIVVLVTGVGQTHTVATGETVEYLIPDTSAPIVMSVHQIVDVVARVCFAPFMGYFEFIDGVQPGLLDYLFLPLAFLYPLAIFIGYLMGPKTHAKKLKMYEEGKKKKLRRIKADKRRRQQPRQPKPEV